MPTAEAFRAAAVSLRTAGRTAGEVELIAQSVGTNHGMLGGPITELVEHATMAARIRGQDLQDRCEEVALECDHRAEVCDEYTRELREYQDDRRDWFGRFAEYDAFVNGGPSAAAPGTLRPPPERLYPWVEAS